MDVNERVRENVEALVREFVTDGMVEAEMARLKDERGHYHEGDAPRSLLRRMLREYGAAVFGYDKAEIERRVADEEAMEAALDRWVREET